MIRTARFAGWASIAGAVVGVVVTPFMASVWEYDYGVVWSTTEGLVTRVFGPTLESWGALSFGSDGLPYEFIDSKLHERRERVFLLLAGLFLGSMTMLNILGVTRFQTVAPRGSE